MTEHIEEARKLEPLGHISEYGFGKLKTRRNYCVSVSHQAEKEYTIGICLLSDARAALAEKDMRIEELEADKWAVKHVDTMNDLASMRVALDSAESRIAELDADHLEERLAMSGRIQFLEDASAVPHLEQRIAELEKRLADASRVIEPFAPIAAVYDGHEDSDPIWAGFVAGVQKRITVGHLRAARAYMEGK